MLFAFSVAPSGPAPSDSAQQTQAATDSVSQAVAAAVRVVRDSGLVHHTDAMFTTIEGDWDECLEVIKQATMAVGNYGSRVSLVLKADIRPGWTGELTGKLARLENALTHSDPSDA